MTTPLHEDPRAVRQGHIAMLVFSAFVAGSFSLGGMMAREISPLALMAARFLFAVVILVIYLTLSGRSAQMRSLRLAPWRFPLLGGIFSGYFVLMFEGLKTANPVSVAAVFTLTPFLTAATAWFILRQRTNMRIWLGLIVGACGALWVIFRGDLVALRAFEIGRGEVIFFVGCVLHAIYIPLLRHLNKGEGPLVSTLGVLSGGLMVLSVVAWRDIVATDWTNLSPLVWVTLAYLVTFATIISFSLIQFGSMRLVGSKVMAYSFLTPSWVILWELALGHGAPTALVLGGIALTLVALLMLLKTDG